MGLPALIEEQRRWLEMIRDHIAANLSIEADDFDYAPFAQQGGLGKFCQVFGESVGAYGNTPLQDLLEGAFSGMIEVSDKVPKGVLL